MTINPAFGFLLAGTALLAGCQSPAATQSAVAAVTPTAAVAAARASAATLTASVAPPAAPASAADAPTPDMRTLLEKCDFAPLLQLTREEDAHPHEGFYGPDHYRIEVALLEVRRDSARPLVYHVRGKDRYKGVITPFAGTLTLTQVVDQPGHSARDRAEMAANGLEGKHLDDYMADQPNLYTALGKFELTEDSTRRGAGIFRGQLALDFKLDPATGVVELQSQTLHSLTEGGDVKFEGTWTGASKAKSFVWVSNLFGFARGRQVLSNFLIGEREPDFNPKYAKLGWSSYWENDEWWAETPTAQL